MASIPGAKVSQNISLGAVQENATRVKGTPVDKVLAATEEYRGEAGKGFVGSHSRGFTLTARSSTYRIPHVTRGT